MHDPAEARRSIRRLLDLPVSILCFDHGEALTEDPKAALRSLVERSA
jgi:hypothetical protein